MAGILNAELAFPQFPALDQYGPNTTLLLHGDGTNGAQNNTFLDSSTNNFTITRNGNTTQGTFSPFSQPNGYWSNKFNGSTDVIYATETSSQFTFGTGDYTYECWIYPTSDASTQRTIFGRTNTGNVAVPYIYLVTTTGVVSVYYSSTIVSGVTAIPSNAWTHIMVSRLSGTTRIFVNGNQEGSAADTTNLTTPTAVMIGGSGTSPTNAFNGYISNARILKGTGYSSITVPTSPLTAITNTSLLTCQSNRFVDNSTNAFALTIVGTPSVQSFHPISAPTAYYPAVNGGAGYFDGSGDYLATPTTSQPTASGDFTISCWFYLQSFGANYYAVGGNWTSGTSGEWLIQIQNNGTIRFLTTADGTFAGTVRLNEWTYFSASRSGSTVTVQLNGSTIRTYTLTGTLGVANETINIGQQVGNNWPWNGYIADFNFNTTTATTAVPTAPASVVSGTSLLLKFQNAGIIDSVSQNQLETVGNAQVSTTQSKFGGASMYFDGTGDYLTAPSNPNLAFGTGDFTIEYWMYSNDVSSSTQRGMFQTSDTAGGLKTTYTTGIFMGQGYSGGNLSGAIRANINGTDVASSGAVLTTGVWYHIAVVRSSGIVNVYVNGNSVATGTVSSSITGTYLAVGGYYNTSFLFNGYIDDFRITAGIARYTQNFTPPQNAYPNYGPLTNIPTVDPNFKNTTLLLHGNGTNGAQNNTFLDSSTNNFTITRNGNTTQGTFTPFSQPNGWWSNYFNGSSYLYSAIDASLALGTSDFTIEAWVYFTTNTTTQTTICAGPGTTTYDMIFGYTYNGAPSIVLYLSSTGSSWDLASGVAMSPNNNIANSWNHIALTRSGSTFRTFFNGSQQATFTSSASVYQSANQFCIGSSQRSAGNANYMNGYISNAKVVIGTSLYNSNFTPSTLPLTATTNTKLITCQSNYFKDNSSNSLAIGASGTPSAQNFYPFFPPLDYSTAAIGGSGYFDGSGDYLSAANNAAFNLGTGDFTIETWVYPFSVNSGNANPIITQLTSSSNTGWLLGMSSGSLWQFSTGSSVIVRAGTVVLNQWTHLAAVRSSGTTTLYVNGVSVGNTSTSFNFTDTDSLLVGYQATFGIYFNGYVSNARIVKGTAVYTSNFTPSTTPLTAITNTSLLLSCTNGAIFDNASKNDLETVGNAQISTTQSKFGGSSMYFNAGSDWLSLNNSPIPSTGDFTVELWFWSSTATTTFQGLFGFLGNSSGYAVTVGLGTTSATGASGVFLNVATGSSSWGINANSPTGITSNSAWYHLALVRSGGTITVYVNGNAVIISAAIAATTALGGGTINRVGALTNNYPLSGYIDDFRVTQYARYRYNFTPPAAPFPNK